MSVKLIFRTLIGTIAVIVISMLIVEFVNSTLVSAQMVQMVKLASRQAAVLFSQESYKVRETSSQGTINMDTLLNSDGNEYVRGDFYSSTSANAIYNSLYGDGSNFDTWIEGGTHTFGHTTVTVTGGSSEGLAKTWHNLELVSLALEDGGAEPPLPDWSDDDSVQRYTDKLIGNSYYQTLMTPLNMGIPYLDPVVLEKMFKWNLTQILSDCKRERIINKVDLYDDSAGDETNYYVQYNGFKVYTSQAIIKKLDYQIFDLNESAQANAFKEATGIDASSLNSSGWSASTTDTGDVGLDERRYICIVGIEVSVPVGFNGITPLRQIVKFAYHDVSTGAGTDADAFDWDDTAIDDLETGGFTEGIASSLPVPGRLIYYIIR